VIYHPGMPRQPLTRPWTPAEIAMLRRMWGDDRSIYTIAAKLDRSASGIRARATLLRLKRSGKQKPPTRESAEQQ